MAKDAKNSESSPMAEPAKINAAPAEAAPIDAAAAAEAAKLAKLSPAAKELYLWQKKAADLRAAAKAEADAAKAAAKEEADAKAAKLAADRLEADQIILGCERRLAAADKALEPYRKLIDAKAEAEAELAEAKKLLLPILPAIAKAGAPKAKNNNGEGKILAIQQFCKAAGEGGAAKADILAYMAQAYPLSNIESMAHSLEQMLYKSQYCLISNGAKGEAKRYIFIGA